jgi:hypothetical protein
MVRLSRTTEQRDALNVLAAGRREIDVQLVTERPLRKPKSRAQVAWMERLRADAATQLGEQLDARTRRAFRGRIAVEMRVRMPTGRIMRASPRS